mmetsp:Transcript_93559/g.164893  ORF Transcript_93559/g.164893 Transcript_93559/m.164893 type:complete len:903 (-) Transcript_93559:38-2746(-)
MQGGFAYFVRTAMPTLLVAGFFLELVASFDVAVDKSGVISDSDNSWRPDEARAAVFSEQKEKFPKGRATQAVELLRFISAYKAGVEALVDITPYSALIRAASDDEGELNFYAFIDTWVGNTSEVVKPIVSMKGRNGTCSPWNKTERGIEYGNGFQVDVNLVFWPQPAGFVDTRPRESVTVSSGWYGSYGIGSISVSEGSLINGATGVQLEPDADFTSAVEAEVYPCPQGKLDVQNGVRIGKLAKKAHRSKGNSTEITGIEMELYKQLSDQALDYVKVTGSDPDKMEVQIDYDPQITSLEVGMPVFYEAGDIHLERNFSEPWRERNEDDARLQAVGQVSMAANGKATVKMNTPCLPTEASQWLPRLKTPKAADALERARILSQSIAHSLSDTKAQPTSFGYHGGDEADNIELLQQDGADSQHAFKPFLVCAQGEALLPMKSLGRLSLKNLSFAASKDCGPTNTAFLQTRAAIKKHESMGSGSTVNASVTSNAQLPVVPTGSRLSKAAIALSKAKAAVGGTTLSTLAGGAKDGDKVCVLTRRATGRVFERSFAMPDFTKQDSVLLQFSSTGHGWSGSTEQCGEYCHAVYHLQINGQKALHITEWRDDCSDNPISRQYGTWELSRNGWCPGSVEPGLYIDVTKWMKEGKNQLTVDVDVWSSKDNSYKAYTNYGGFFGGDSASLFVGASFFVYDQAAVDAIKSQSHHFTAAEKALANGCSMPEALKPPKEARPAFSSYLQQSLTSEALEELDAKQGFSSTKKQEVKKNNFLQQGSPRNRADRDEDTSAQRYDFEREAPWYLYSEAEKNGLPGLEHGTNVVKVFKDSLIQINSREIFAKVKRSHLPRQWAQAAMHIRLEAPVLPDKSLELDHWDRLGSAGLLFKASTPKVQLHPAMTSWESKKLNLA